MIIGISQRQIRDFIFDTVNDAEQHGRPHEICYVKETKTWYEFVENGSAYTVDHLSILSTGGSAGSRWIGFAGYYCHSSIISTFTFALPYEIIRNRWLAFNSIPSNVNGVPIPLNGELFAISVRVATTSSGWIRVRKLAEPSTNVYSIQLSSQTEKFLTNLHIPVLTGDTIGIFVESSAGLDTPIVNLTFRFRQ